MAFSHARTSKGFEFVYTFSGMPGIIRNYIAETSAAIVMGDYMVLTTGTASKAGANATAGLGAAQEAVASSATGQDVDVIINPDAIYCCSFDTPLATYGDQAVASAGATNYIGLTTQLGGDDYPNGGYAVCYDGADKGSVYVVTDYDDAAGNVTAELILDRTHAMDTTSYVYMLGDADATGEVIGPGSLVDLTDENTLDADDDGSSGPFRVLDINALDGTLDVVATDHIFNIV